MSLAFVIFDGFQSFWRYLGFSGVFGPQRAFKALRGGGLKNSKNRVFLENGGELGKSKYTVKLPIIMRIFGPFEVFDGFQPFWRYLGFSGFSRVQRGL